MPTTSAASIFQYEVDATTVDPVIFHKKNPKGVNENRLYFQSSSKLNVVLPDDYKSSEVLQTEQEECYPISGQSVNSSGILNEIVGNVSFSNVEISSDKESGNEDD